MSISINYGTRTEFGSDSNLASLANAAACAIGQVDNHSAGNCGYLVDFTIVGASSGVSATGTVVFYLIQAPNVSGSPGTYTDGISVTGASVAGAIKNARLVYVANLNANSLTINDCFLLPVPDPGAFWSLVILNSSGAALAASGHSVYYEPFTYND
jgi:hypothetical protein